MMMVDPVKIIHANGFGSIKLEVLTEPLKPSYPGNLPKCEGFMQMINNGSNKQT